MKLTVKVSDLMTHEVITVRPHTDLSTADVIMQLKRLRHLPVIKEDKLIGLITHRDIIKAQISSTVDLSAKEGAKLRQRVHAEEIMSRDVISASPDDNVIEAGRKMLNHQLGCLPVVKDEKLVGIITEVDLLAFFLDILERV